MLLSLLFLHYGTVLIYFVLLLLIFNDIDYYHLFQSIDFSANEPDYYVIDKLVTNNISIPKFLEVTRETLINMGLCFKCKQINNTINKESRITKI